MEYSIILLTFTKKKDMKKEDLTLQDLTLQDLTLFRRTIALLSSMVVSGEVYTARRKQMKNNALDKIEELRKKLSEPTNDKKEVAVITAYIQTHELLKGSFLDTIDVAYALALLIYEAQKNTDWEDVQWEETMESEVTRLLEENPQYSHFIPL